jgi:tetratricopeptide (TPR) repeat protein
MIKLWKYSKPMFYGLLSLLIFSLFSYPFELLPFRIITILIVAWAASSPTNEGKVEKTCWGTAFSLVLLTLAYLTTKEIAIRHVSDKEYSLFARMEHEAFIKDFYELLPLERDNARFLFDFGKTLRKQGRYNDSNDMLRRGTRVSADPMFYVIMGNNYMDMGECDLAEQHYRKAFSTLPNRLYPLYQLMLLNKACDDADKTTFYARKVISFKEKVASPATQKMKEDARLYLQQQKDCYISE